MKLKQILQNIFSVKNQDFHKVITFLGFKIKFKNTTKIEQNINQLIQKEQLLNQKITQLINEKESFMTWNYNPLGWCDDKLKYALQDMDNVRLTTLELVLREMKRNNVTDGAIAEIGVFQGDFASKIGEFLPDNKFYLFDTFDGFNNQDTQFDKENNYSEIDNDFTNTTEEMVLSKITNPQRCIIKKGYFPDTAAGLEEKFIFVSIDPDLYKPAIAALEYFYPRLVEGGYIFLHDFNHSQYRGIKKALYEFMESDKIKYIPIPDISGTVVIAK